MAATQQTIGAEPNLEADKVRSRSDEYQKSPPLTVGDQRYGEEPDSAYGDEMYV